MAKSVPVAFCSINANYLSIDMVFIRESGVWIARVTQIDTATTRH
jgi:hypothetical protein